MTNQTRSLDGEDVQAMTKNLYPLPRLTLTTPAAYLIRFRGRVDRNWIEYFDNFLIVVSASPGRVPETTLSGRVRDQAALLGILHCLYSYGNTLISVECVGG
jgi:hypothetical protein